MKKHDEETPAPEQPEQQAAEDPAKQNMDQMLRLKADLENTRKRLEREKQESIRYANEKLLVEVLPIMDDLDRAMASLTEGHDAEKILQGLKLAQQQLHQVFERHGVQAVKGVGEAFDPNVHEAVGMVDAPPEKDGLVMDEVQRGYTLNGRLIRPSRVRIAKLKEEE